MINRGKENQPAVPEFPGGKSEYDVSYEEGLDWVEKLFEESKGSLLLVVNGAGPNAGKTSFVGDSMKIAKEMNRPVINYEGELRGHEDIFKAMLERYEGEPVILKTMEQKAEIKKDSVKKLFRERTEKLVKSEAEPFLEKLGYGLDEVGFVNISSPKASFKSDRFPADIGVRIK